MNISLSWFKEIFKTEKEKELEKLRVEEQKLKNKILNKDLELYTVTPTKDPEEKLYKKLKLVNDCLTVVLNNGDVLTKCNASQDDFNAVREAFNENEILKVFTSLQAIKEKEKKEIELQTQRNIIKGIEVLKNSQDFEVVDSTVYMKGIKRSLPALLVEKFASLYGKYEGLNVEETVEYQSLKKFWLKCCLNPNAQSAEDLYEFLANHQFKIDKHGNFYAYRRVVSRETDNKELVEFVSNAYNKIKAIWKKKPSDYFIFQLDNGEFTLSKDNFQDGINKLHGNLQDLYLNLPNMQEKTYTSAHTGQEDYRVGEIISMPRDKGDDDNRVSCSKGFHAASKAYDYTGFGDTPILVIINPMDVLAVPHGEVGKLRTCRWFFAMTLPENEEHILDDDDFDVSELGDVFEEKSQVTEEYVQNSFAEEVKRHTFTLPTLSSTEMGKIITSLEEMRNSISNRVQTV